MLFRSENETAQGAVAYRQLTIQQQSAIRFEAAIGDRIRRD